MFETLGPDDRWRPTRVIGTGGFATVYAAVDTRFESDVAIKVLAQNFSENLEIRQRFLNEALLQRSLAGVVVPVFDTGETPHGQPFMVMALANGGDLEQRLERLGPSGAPTIDDLFRIAQVLSDALEALHHRSIVHRDLKPSNMLIFGPAETPPEAVDGGRLLGPGETILLSDLGLAKDLARSSGLTVAGGTPGFTPPEQRKPGLVDIRADIWAASAILHWLTTRRPPGHSADRPSADLGLGDFGDELISVIDRGLADDPDERPDSIADWHRSVRLALAVGAGRSPTPRNRASMSRIGLAATAVGAALFGFGLAQLNWADGDGPPQTATVLDGGLIVQSVTDDGLTVSITGPSTVTIGEVASYRAELDDEIVTWTWISPDGRMVVAQPTLPIRATTAGTGTVMLLASTSEGRTVRVEFPFAVSG